MQEVNKSKFAWFGWNPFLSSKNRSREPTEGGRCMRFKFALLQREQFKMKAQAPAWMTARMFEVHDHGIVRTVIVFAFSWKRERKMTDSSHKMQNNALVERIYSWHQSEIFSLRSTLQRHEAPAALWNLIFAGEEEILTMSASYCWVIELEKYYLRGNCVYKRLVWKGKYYFSSPLTCHLQDFNTHDMCKHAVLILTDTPVVWAA